MSDYIKLDDLEAIKKWIEANPPKEVELIIQSAEDFKKKRIEQPAKGGVFYGVQHIYYDADGQAVIALGGVYRAKTAEEALAQYVYGPSRHMTGTGEDCVDVTTYDNFKRSPQEIAVFQLARGTDRFL